MNHQIHTNKQTPLEAAYGAYELQLGRDDNSDEDLIKASLAAYLNAIDVEEVSKVLIDAGLHGPVRTSKQLAQAILNHLKEQVR